MFCNNLLRKALAVLCFVVLLLVSAGMGESPLEARDTLIEALSGDEVEILILLEQQADTGKAAREARRAQGFSADPRQAKTAVRSKVVEILQETARTSQPSLLRYLEKKKTVGRVTEIKTFFIVNVVYAQVSNELAETIAQRPEVDSVWPNRRVQLVETAKEAETLSGSAIEWNIQRVRAPEVWNTYGVDGSGVVVGFIDTGVDWGHEALKRKYRGYDPLNPDAPDHKYNWYDPYYGTASPDDWNGHGTHCTGVALGSDPAGDNKIGVAPGAQWIAARGLNDEGAGTLDIILDAMEYMLAPKGSDGDPDPAMAPDIVNNSWGADPICDPIFKSAIQSWRDAEILPVFAAGNAGPDAGTIALPANYEESFAVGATDSKDNLAEFSSRGPGACGDFWKPNLSAPGVNIHSAQSENPSHPRGYAATSGTSAAAPHIAGVAALLRSADTSLSVDELEAVMTETALSLTGSGYPGSPNHGFGHGLVDALAAVEELVEEKLPVQYTLTIDIKGEGATVPEAGAHVYDEGTDVSLSVDPAQGWEFEKWEVNGEEITNYSTQLTMNSNTTATAYFELETEPVVIPDPNLEEAIRDALNKLEGDITEADMAGILVLEASERGIEDLTGLEYSVNLVELSLYDNQVEDLGPLENLVSLEELFLGGNQLRDIAPISGLTNLEALVFGNNQVMNITPLANLTHLERLFLAGNQVTDISALGNLTNLEELWIGYNQIGDITHLQDLTNLRELGFPGNQVSEISALANLTNLHFLRFAGNQVEDISPLEKLKNLRTLMAGHNNISDISVLANLTDLQKLNVQYNYLNISESSDAMQLIQQLKDDGVNVEYEPQKEALELPEEWIIFGEHLIDWQLFLEDPDTAMHIVNNVILAEYGTFPDESYFNFIGQANRNFHTGERDDEEAEAASNNVNTWHLSEG